MSDLKSLRVKAVEYRVRLFLSVDLSGSTAFKNSKDGEGRKTGEPPNWVIVFQRFYSDFPSMFATEFRQQKNAGVGLARIIHEQHNVPCLFFSGHYFRVLLRNSRFCFEIRA